MGNVTRGGIVESGGREKLHRKLYRVIVRKTQFLQLWEVLQCMLVCIRRVIPERPPPHSSGFNLTRRNNVPDSSSSANVTYMLHVKRKISYSVGNNFKLLPVSNLPIQRAQVTRPQECSWNIHLNWGHQQRLPISGLAATDDHEQQTGGVTERTTYRPKRVTDKML